MLWKVCKKNKLGPVTSYGEAAIKTSSLIVISIFLRLWSQKMQLVMLPKKLKAICLTAFSHRRSLLSADARDSIQKKLSSKQIQHINTSGITMETITIMFGVIWFEVVIPQVVHIPGYYHDDLNFSFVLKSLNNSRFALEKKIHIRMVFCIFSCITCHAQACSLDLMLDLGFSIHF